MPQAGGNPGFSNKPQNGRRAPPVGKHHLDGHLAIQVDFPGLEHHSHAAAGDLADDFVTVDLRRRVGGGIRGGNGHSNGFAGQLLFGVGDRFPNRGLRECSKSGIVRHAHSNHIKARVADEEEFGGILADLAGQVTRRSF